MKKIDLDWVRNIVSDDDLAESIHRELHTVITAAKDNVRPPLHMVVYSVGDKEGGNASMAFVQVEIGEGVDKAEAYSHVGKSVCDGVSGIPIIAVLVAESWYVFHELKDGTDEEVREVKKGMAKYSSLSEHPDRREMILITAQTLDGRKAAAFMPFDSLEDGTIDWIRDDFDFLAPADLREDGPRTVQHKPLEAFYTGVKESSTFARINEKGCLDEGD